MPPAPPVPDLPTPSTEPWLSIPGWRRASLALDLMRRAELNPRTRSTKSNARFEAQAMLSLILAADPNLPAEIAAYRADLRKPTP